MIISVIMKQTLHEVWMTLLNRLLLDALILTSTNSVFHNIPLNKSCVIVSVGTYCR